MSAEYNHVNVCLVCNKLITIEILQNVQKGTCQSTQNEIIWITTCTEFRNEPKSGLIGLYTSFYFILFTYTFTERINGC